MSNFTSIARSAKFFKFFDEMLKFMAKRGLLVTNLALYSI